MHVYILNRKCPSLPQGEHMVRSLILIAGVLTVSTVRAEAPAVQIAPDVVYGHKDGLAMTFDVFTPTMNSNQAGVLFMVSGGWYSNWSPPEALKRFYEPLTSRGFTVFTVRHGSSPRYGIPDAVADVRRAVRFIRLNAERFHVDPNRLGVYGMSAGGHLSLMLGTASDAGNPTDRDPVLRVSDRVQAVVAYVAPTDLRIMVKGAPDRLPAYAKFPALDLDLAGAATFSPLAQVTPDDAPTLLLAGAKDELVPIDHSRKIHKALDEHKVPTKLVEYPHAGHGIAGNDLANSVQEMVSWFELHLAAKK